jgi:hypothetical protein
MERMGAGHPSVAKATPLEENSRKNNGRDTVHTMFVERSLSQRRKRYGQLWKTNLDDCRALLEAPVGARRLCGANSL